MSTLDLDEIERLEKEATPGPWTVEPEEFDIETSDIDLQPDVNLLCGSYIKEIYTIEVGDGRYATSSDNKFIAALRNAAPELIRLARIGKEAEAREKAAYIKGSNDAWKIARGEDE